MPREFPRFNSRIQAVYASVGPAERGVRFVAAAEDQPAEILLYDEIGFWGVTAKDFAAAVARAGDAPLRVRINSPGGEVFDGLAMYSMLKNHAAGVECVVDGLAASAASFIALAGSSVKMMDGAFLMIHNAWDFVVGNRNDLRKSADTLDKIDGQLAAIYATKTGKSTDDIAAMMDAETWFTAQEAVDNGFADNIVKPPSNKKNIAELKIAVGAPPENMASVREQMQRRLRLAEAEI